MNHTLIQYLRNSDRTPYGVVVATIRPSDNKIGIGFSAVKPKSGDKFDKELGLKIAIGRAVMKEDRANKDAVFAALKNHNPDAYHTIYSMYHRACSYFKNMEVILP
jgi:hypothetical protein